ncbi:MAG: aspartate aminotransferase family protein [Acidimicrobiia bacterium]
MGLQGPTTSDWYQRANAALVNGVSSGFRFWGPDDTLVIQRGDGAYVEDMDGKRYVDYQLGFGPVILGHAHPAISSAVAEAAASGTTFAMTSAREIEAAELFKAAVPWVDRLRFTNTGTEATMHAIRLARAVTGKELVLKFEGAYHGAHDYVLFSTASAAPAAMGSRRSPVPLQSSSGIPEAIRALVRTLPFNDLEAVKRLFARDGGRIACVIVEPIMGNYFGVMPDDGYLAGLRSLCDEHGVVLIFDEVKTGFRIALGGAQEWFGVTPDLATFAKSMGNGFPVAAVAGREHVVGAWADGGVMQAGTYSGNGLSAAATAATIRELLTGAPLAAVDRAGTALIEGIRGICSEKGLAAHVLGPPSMFGIFLGEEPPRDFRDVGGHDEELYSKVVMGMIARGVMPCDDAREPWFVSAAHGDAEVELSLTAFSDALTEALG